MDISKIDYWATSGTSFLHRAAVVSKLLATAFVIAGVILAGDVAVLAGLYLMVMVTVRAARLPLVKVMLISLFPGLFAVLYAISQAGAGWTLPAVIIMKALTAASAMILLISTTPYTSVVGFMGRLMPRVVADGLFMTYRSFFILLELMDHFLKALKLRGGFQPHRLIRNARNVAAGVGMLFIRAFDKSQRLYDVMSIRGYSGRLAATRRLDGFGARDLPYLLAAFTFLTIAIYVRVYGQGARVMALTFVLAVYVIGMEAHRVWKRS